MVVLAVEAIDVLSSQAPPVKVFLHPLHLQIPTETFLMAGYEHKLLSYSSLTFPHSGQTYLYLCMVSNFFISFLNEEPYLGPYFLVMPTFLVLLVI